MKSRLWGSRQEALSAANRVQYRVKEKAQEVYRQHGTSDTVAILVHGFTGSPWDLKELADYLYDNGTDVLVVRLAGHGTAHEDLMQTRYHDWQQSVREAIARVSNEYQNIFLVGYSFGGNLVLDAAHQMPDKFRGIVCLGTSIFLNMNPITLVYLRSMNRILRLLGKKKWRKSYVPKDRVEIFESTGNYAYIPLVSMMDFDYFIRKHTPRQLHEIKTPILIIHSRGDRVTHPRSSEYLFEHVGSTYKELFMIPEFNHNPLRSESKEKIFNKVLDFVNG